ncbi:hypothetical protein L7F22_044100 [Adiantum nelumboides]|nr:hypothetical protein [Adiantum nelumboides]
MQPISFLGALSLAFIVSVQCATHNKRAQANAADWDTRSTPFPPVRRGDVVFQYRSEAAKGNVSIADPYNYFETSDSSDFNQAQLAFTKAYLNKLEDLNLMRTAIKDANAPIFRTPIGFGPKEDPLYLYYFGKDGYGSGNLFSAKQNDIDDAAKNHFATFPGKVLIDETLLGGQLLYLYQISPDGSKLLYSTADIKTFANVKLFVRDLSSPLNDKSKPNQEGGYGRYADVITDLEIGSEVWSGDSKGYFYVASDTSVRYHLIGTNNKEDIVVVQPNKDDQGDWWVQFSKDGNYIILYGSVNGFDTSRVYVASLDQGISTSMSWLCIAPDYTFAWNYTTNVGTDFYFSTSKGAPNQQFVQFTLDFTKAKKSDNSFSTFTQGSDSIVVIPETPDTNLAYYTIFDTDKVLVKYEKDNMLAFSAFNLKTGILLQKLDLGILSTSVEMHAYPFATDIYLQVSSLNTPTQLYDLKWNRVSNKFSSELIFQQNIHNIDSSSYIVERHTAPSKAGDVKIPFFILYRKGLKFDGSHPAIINFFGAFGYTFPTWYDSHHFAFVHKYDGLYILAAPRGGGELGDDWHKAGQLQNKQNTIDDVIAISQYAIDQKWTSSGKVILNVQYSAALASAAVVNQAPEGMFGAFVGTSGLYDMLRLDQSTTHKASRIAEYGSPSDPKAFDWLRKYSPLHNIDQKKSYPTILLYPPVDDGGVGGEVWHSFKMISELQYSLSSNSNPILLGNGTDTQEERSATAFALAAYTIGFKSVN